MPVDWSPLLELTARYERYVLTSHQRADCDALGSELAMAAVLEAAGKQVRIVHPDEVPANLGFIDPGNKIEVLGRDLSADEAQQTDVMIVLDTSAWIQLGDMADVLRGFAGPRLVIDHHVSGDDLGATMLKDQLAPATGCLVLEAADALGVAIDLTIARPTFLAIATDTGWFRFPSVQAETYRQIARLIDAGVRPDKLYNLLYEQETLGRLLLRGHILRGAQAELSGRLLYSVARQSDFAACQAETTDTEDAINFMLRVAGSEVALLFVELPTGATKISFRSRGQIDVRQLAEQFGGGGHTMASGATVEGDFESVKTRILDSARQTMG
jgi:phosphoesterase RecJ-like protein